MENEYLRDALARLARQRAPIRVLVADDDDFFAECLATALQLDESVEIIGRAGDGRVAVELCASLRPDVVLMDVEMPIMDGIAATTAIRKRFPGVRVVILSARANPEDVERAVAAGAVRFLAKGAVSVEAVHEAIADAASRVIPFPVGRRRAA